MWVQRSAKGRFFFSVFSPFVVWKGPLGKRYPKLLLRQKNGPNTVSESTVSNTELSEVFGPHRVPGRELSRLFVRKRELTEFLAELTELAPKLSEAQ